MSKKQNNQTAKSSPTLNGIELLMSVKAVKKINGTVIGHNNLTVPVGMPVEQMREIAEAMFNTAAPVVQAPVSTPVAPAPVATAPVEIEIMEEEEFVDGTEVKMPDKPAIRNDATVVPPGINDTNEDITDDSLVSEDVDGDDAGWEQN